MNVINFSPKDAIEATHRKEKYFTDEYAVIAYKDGQFTNPVSLRFYKTPSAIYYCCVWIYGNARGSARDNPKGYNYNKQAAAADKALRNAGCEFDQEIASYSHYEPALKAIALHLGYTDFTVFHAAG